MIWTHLINAFANFGINDFFDIFFMTAIFYYLILLIKGTKSYQVAVGLLLIGVAAVMSRILHLTAFSYILNAFLSYLILAIIILFQDELRRILAEIGGRIKTRYNAGARSGVLDEILNAVLALSLSRIGAIIAIERKMRVENYVNKPVRLDALVNKDLLLTIFTPGAPLHDGAVVVKDERIEAARCFFPLPPLLELSPSGTRHLAAIGITQQTDCVVIVVSEETGKISFAVDGELVRGLDREGLKSRLQQYVYK